MRWLKDHVAVLFLVAVSIVLTYLWFRGFIKTTDDPGRQLSDKAELIKFKHEVFRLKRLHFAEKAREKIQERYAVELEAMNEAEKQKAKDLAHDPDALVDFIVTTSRSRA